MNKIKKISGPSDKRRPSNDCIRNSSQLNVRSSWENYNKLTEWCRNTTNKYTSTQTLAHKHTHTHAEHWALRACVCLCNITSVEKSVLFSLLLLKLRHLLFGSHFRYIFYSQSVVPETSHCIAHTTICSVLLFCSSPHLVPLSLSRRWRAIVLASFKRLHARISSASSVSASSALSVDRIHVCWVFVWMCAQVPNSLQS